MAVPPPRVRVLDVPPAVLRILAASRPRDYPLLLDSVAPGPLGRASILAARPRAALWLDARGRVGSSGPVPRVTRISAEVADLGAGHESQPRRRKTSEPLVPPNPKEFDRATSILIGLAVFGTKSRSQSGSGVW